MEEWEKIKWVASEQQGYAYNLYFCGVINLLNQTFFTLARNIRDMMEYLPSDVSKNDPRALVEDLLNWDDKYNHKREHKYGKKYKDKLDKKALAKFDSSDGRLDAAGDARNLIVHPKRMVFQDIPIEGEETSSDDRQEEPFSEKNNRRTSESTSRR